MIGMVAFCQNAEPLLGTSPRARGQSRDCVSDASRCSKSVRRPHLRRSNSGGRVRLVTCSRDPIGYEGGSWSLYHYVFSNPLYWVDSLGLCPADKDCSKIYQNMLDEIDREYNEQLEGIKKETADLLRMIREQAESSLEIGLKDCDSAYKNAMEHCNAIDDSTIAGAIERTGCVILADSMYATATGSVYTSVRAWHLAAVAQVMAYESGQLVGLHAFVVTAKAAAREALKECEGRGGLSGPKL